MRNKKAQAAITDLFVAIAIFITLVTITTTMWNLYSSRLSGRVAYDDMVVKSFQLSDVMFKTSGNPSTWETLDFSSQGDIDSLMYVGMVDNQDQITYDKVVGLGSLINEGNETLKDIFHIGQYNFNFKMLNATGSLMYDFGDPIVHSKYVVNLAKTMIFLDEYDIQKAVTVEVSLSR